MKRLSVIVPSFNSEKVLNACLDSLLVFSDVKADEVIVVDDGSSDRSASIACRPGVRLVVSDKNTGPGAARNRGAAQATGEVLVFVDADIALCPDAVGRVSAYFAGQHGCAAVIGSYDNAPSANSVISQYRNLLHRYVHQNTTQQASHFWTGIGAVEKSAFRKIGGFEEAEFGRALEDVEFGYRLRDAGYCIQVDPSIQGKHLKHWTLVTMLRTDLFLRAIPWTYLLLARKKMPVDFSLGWNQRASVVLAWLLPCLAVSAFIYPIHIQAAGLTMLSFLMVNGKFFRYLQREQGCTVALVAIPLHWLYHFNSGLGFLLGTIGFFRRRLARQLLKLPRTG